MLRLRSALTALAAVAVLGTAACDLSTENTATDVEPRDLVYAPALGVNFETMEETEAGLYYQDIGPAGTGALIQATDSVAVHYKLWLPNGTLIEDRSTGTPTRFWLPAMIPGWRLGIPGMHVGGTRKLVVRPALAYGNSSVGPIPRLSVLVFEVTVVERILPAGS